MGERMSASSVLQGQIQRLNRRVQELEAGACRFNCRGERAAWVACSNVDTYDMDDEKVLKAFKEWKDGTNNRKG